MMASDSITPKSNKGAVPLILSVNGKTQTLSNASAELARLLFKFAAYMSDEDFNATYVWKISKGQLVESKFEVS